MIENRTNKFVKNAFGTALYQIINTICGLITPRIILLAYGSNINGLVNSITQFLSFLAIMESGLALASQHSLYKPLAEKDVEQISKVVSATRIAYNQVGYLFTTGTIILSFLYPFFAGTEDLDYLSVVILVFVLSMNHILSFFVVSKYQVLFQADQRIYVISIARTVSRIVNTVCIILLASPNFNIILLRIIVSSSVIIQAIIISIYARIKYKNINFKAKPDKNSLTQRGYVFYEQILGFLMNSSPAIILTIIATLEDVSIYSIYNMVFASLLGILGILSDGVNAAFGTLLYSKNTQHTNEVYSEFENFYYLSISIIYSVALVMIVPFVRIYTVGVTDANYLLPGLGFLFTLNSLIYNLRTPHGLMIQAAGKFKETRHQNTIQSIILISLSFILGHFFGIYGILIASILANLYRCIAYYLFVPKHIHIGSLLVTIKRAIIMISVIVIIFISFSLFLRNFYINNFKDWIIISFIVFIASTILFFIVDLIFERKNLFKTIKRVMKIFKGGRND